MACGYNLRTRRPSQACPECGADVLVTIREAERRRIEQPMTLEGFSVTMRMMHILFGVALAAITFGIAELNGGRPMMVEWQSGEIQDYIGMLLGGVPARPFYPFIFFAGAAMIALVKNPEVLGRRLWVRAGLVIGVVIGAQYTLILFGSAGPLGMTAGGFAVVISLVISALAYAFPKRWLDWRLWTWLKPWHFWPIAAILFLIGLVLELVLSGSPFLVIALPIVLCLVLSPWLYMTTYSFALARVMRSVRRGYTATTNDEQLPWWMWLYGGLMGYGFAWAGSVLLAIESYAKLPKQPPDCYVCTAAANGHPRLVKSQPVRLASGRVMHANRQMRLCKAVELTLKTSTPRVHRAVRYVYDRIGPSLARWLKLPVAADLAYLMIAPIAWACGTILSLLIPGFRESVDRLYRD